MLLAFLDLETSGRKHREGNILEIGMVITDPNLDVLGFYQQAVRPLYGDWKWEDDVVRKMHTDNGLIAEIESGDCKRRYEAEAEALTWLESFGPEQFRLVGNSVWFDLNWLREHMLSLSVRFHRQLLDITSLNKFAELFVPDVFKNRPREAGPAKHRALDDASFSLKTLKHYRDRLSLPPNPIYDPNLFGAPELDDAHRRG